VSAFNVNSERNTGLRQAPWYWQRDAHSLQKAAVFVSAVSASNRAGGGRCDGPQVSVKTARSPAATVNSATVA
jgi:hypothetical protein